jgi:hypothetical protein
MATGTPMPPMVSMLDPPGPQCSTITASAALTATRPHAPSTSSLTSFTIFTPLAKNRAQPSKKHGDFSNRKQEERLCESQARSSIRPSANGKRRSAIKKLGRNPSSPEPVALPPEALFRACRALRALGWYAMRRWCVRGSRLIQFISRNADHATIHAGDSPDLRIPV